MAYNLPFKAHFKALLILCCSPISLLGQVGESTQDNQSLKVISYNIWNGFDYGRDSSRREKCIDWIQSQKPDVVALQELNEYTKDKLLIDAKKWGHHYAEIVKTDGYPVGITSNNPIHIKEKILDHMHHGALHCETWGIDFFVVHFSPFSYQKRHEEADIIISKLQEIRAHQGNYIVLGDFNALSPFDAHFYDNDSQMLAASMVTERQHDQVRNLHLNRFEYGLMSRYIGFPLIDVVQLHTHELEERLSFPSQIFEQEADRPRYGHPKRIDYIMVSPTLAKSCTYASVLNDFNTYYLSDHYPVVASFQLLGQ